MRQVFFSICLAFGLFLSSQPSHAQIPADMSQDIQTITSWSSQYNEVQIELVGLFNLPSFVILVEMASASDEDFDTDAYQATLDLWEIESRDTLATIRTKIDALPPIPKLQTPQFREMGKTLQKARKDRYKLFAEYEQLMRQTQEIFALALDGNTDAMQKLQPLLYKNTVRLLEAENLQMKGSQKALPANHPSYFLVEMMIESNKFTIYELDMLASVDDQSPNWEEREPFLPEMQSSIEKSQKAYSQTISATRANKNNIVVMASKANISTDSHLYKTAMAVMDQMIVAADKEREMNEVSRDILKLYERKDDLETFQPKIDVLNEKILELVNDRLQLQADRLKLASSLK